MTLRQKETLRAVKKFLLIVVGIPFFCALCFFVWFSMVTSVGRLNFLTVNHLLDNIVEAAEKSELKSGQRMIANLEGNTLVAHEFFGNVEVFKTPSGSILIKVDRGGGHLGNQGYLYSETTEINAAEAFGYADREGYDTSRMSLCWWSYDSNED